MTTTTPAAPTTPESLLRTLAPALRALEKGLRLWLDAEHHYPLATMTRAALQGLTDDPSPQVIDVDFDVG